MSKGLLKRLDRRHCRSDDYTQQSAPDKKPAGLKEILSRFQREIIDNHSDLLLNARIDPNNKGALKAVIQRLLLSESVVLPRMSRDVLTDVLLNEIVGFGPIDPLIRDTSITEIMVNGASKVYVERNGRIERTDIIFRDESHVLDIINRIIGPLGRRIDKSSPYVDSRLPDGSRINAIIAPLALTGPILTIRKFRKIHSDLAILKMNGTLNEDMVTFLRRAVRAKLNTIISGGTSSGKTTTLNALASAVDPAERIITIEDNAEISLDHPHVVSLESRPPNMEGRGEVSVRQLVKNALRMRPDRIIIGEVRGGEAFDLLQALNTGHRGSLSTIHANSPLDALQRLEDMVHMAGEGLPHHVITKEIKSAVDMVIHQSRLRDGSRKIVEICLVDKMYSGKEVGLHTVFRYVSPSETVEYDCQEACFQKQCHDLPEWFKERIRWYEACSDA